MTVTVSIYDHETGETEKVDVPDGDYLLIVTDPATEQTTAYANGTHVITVKDRLVEATSEGPRA